MLRSQRILVGGGLAVLALMMHSSACEWAYKRQQYGGQWGPILRLWTHTDAPPAPASRRNPPVGSPVTGMFPQGGLDRVTAQIVGIFVPLFLLGVDAYLILGWRQRGRIERGQCAHCGYDLRGQAADDRSQTAAAGARCPECGRAPARVD